MSAFVSSILSQHTNISRHGHHGQSLRSQVGVDLGGKVDVSAVAKGVYRKLEGPYSKRWVRGWGAGMLQREARHLGTPNVTFLKKGSRWALAWGDVTLPDMPLEERGSPWDSGGSSASRSRGSASKGIVEISTWADEFAEAQNRKEGGEKTGWGEEKTGKKKTQKGEEQVEERGWEEYWRW